MTLSVQDKREQVARLLKARAAYANSCIHELFERRADGTPDKLALGCHDWNVSYGVLEGRANQLANYLIALGAGPDMPVAIYLERSPDFVLALLGALKAGAAYVPLDPTMPDTRIERLLDDIRAPIILTTESLSGRLPSGWAQIVSLDADWPAIAAESSARPETAVTPANLAYILYTSGSTGLPKGVGVEHRNLANYAGAVAERMGLGADVYAFVSTFAADLGNTVLFGSLTQGGTLHIIDNELAREPAKLGGYFARHGVDVVKITPSHLGMLLGSFHDAALVPLKTLVLGGEASDAGWVASIQRFRPDCEIWNHYGPTETTVGVLTQLLSIDGGTPETIALGRPLANTQVYVLNDALEPVPAGLGGELYVGGANVTRGYQGRPGLTAERFVPDPFGSRPGSRLYRTGDSVRWLEGGTLEFLGRVDDQIKLRGFRIEPGEIEAALLESVGVRQARVILREDTPGDARLVAYIVSDPADFDAARLRAALAAKLPEYMTPSAFVRLDTLPLTANGKLDRKALPIPDESAVSEVDAAAAPRTAVEEILAGIWADVLHVERVGRDSNFFELGGHSLLATQAVSRVRRVLSVDLPLQAMFDQETLAGLAGEVERAIREHGASEIPALVPMAGEGNSWPLSFAQQRLWIINQLDPGNTAYNIARALRLTGDLNVEALQQSLTEIVRRHAVLRTSFPAQDGQPVQHVSAPLPAALPVLDLSGLDAESAERTALQLAREEAGVPFDLGTGPLLRCQLLRLSARDYVLLVTMHHIVTDAWSTAIFIRELTALYAAYSSGDSSPLPDLSVQYADFAVWQRNWLQGEVLDTQLAYWRGQLAGAPILELPTDHARPAVQSHRGAVLEFLVPLEVMRRLKELSRREGVTLFMTLLAGWQALLSRYTGQDDIVVGSPIAGRNRADLEDLIGFFVNSLVLRSSLAGSPSFTGLLARVRDVCLGAYAHQDIPFEQLVDELQPRRDVSRHPLFQAVLAVRNAAPDTLSLKDLSLSYLDFGHATAKFDLMLNLTETPHGLVGGIEYAVDLFERASITRLFGHFSNLLAAAVSAPGRPIWELPLLGEAERMQLLTEFAGVRSEYPADACVHELFERQVDRTPNAVAIGFADQVLTYADLNARANQLARHLEEQGVGPDVRVGLMVERSVEMVVSLLAILKAGGAYVPLDPGYPAERLAFMLADAAAALLVTQENLCAGLSGSSIPVIRIDTVRNSLARYGDQNRPSAANPENLAYVIYTSGSTGRPKGAAIAHRSIVRLVVNTNYITISERDTVLQLASVSFDASTLEIWGALLNGARLAIYPPEMPTLDELGEFIKSKDISLLWLTARLFDQMVDHNLECFRGVRQLLAGGEALSPPHVRRAVEALPQCRIINGYGPTENTTFTACHWVEDAETIGATVPIGRAIANTSVSIVDGNLQPVPVGVPGELLTGGDGLARGYLNDAALTAERFVPDPFSAVPGRRLYRTGDLAKYRPDGTIEYLGRLDQQVKVRGFRIELGEIEAALADHPAVAAAVAMVREDAGTPKRLVAYLSVPHGAEIDAADLRSFLASRLPEYMVPAIFVVLQTLPLTANGKVDRAALPVPQFDQDSVDSEPRTPVEAALARIWAGVLGLPRIGIHDNFFSIGGDSILSIQIVARANQAGITLTPRMMFQYQTIAELSAVCGASTVMEAEQGLVTGPVPLTPIQHWFFERKLADPHHFNQSVLLETEPSVKPEILRTAIQRLVAQHDALRMRFVPTPEGWLQENAGLDEDGMGLFAVMDLSAYEGTAQRDALEQAAGQLQASLDLEVGPIVAARYFTLGPDQPGRLLIVAHHLVIDGVSWRILLEDLQCVYTQLSEETPVTLPAKTTSFKQWSEYLDEHAHSDRIRAEEQYWTGLPWASTRQIPFDMPLTASDSAEANIDATAFAVTEILSAELTGALLHDAPEAYHTQINDILLAALAATLCRWTGNDHLLLALEGHGREDLFADADVSRTVGWFTSLFPVFLQCAPDMQPGELLISTKEALREIPEHGIGYGLLRYLAADSALRAAQEPEVSFNYLGQFDQVLGEGAMFRPADENAGSPRSPRNRRAHVLGVSAMVAGGRLRVTWTASSRLHKDETVRSLASGYMRQLEELVAHCLSPGAGAYTPSDFPDADLSMEQLAAIISGLDGAEPEAIYPLSPMQQGLLFHTLYAPGSGEYVTQGVYDLMGDLDVPAFQLAWQEAVDRHDILRTKFAWEGLAEPVQVVCRNLDLVIEQLDWSGHSQDEQEIQLERLLNTDAEKGFDPSRAPLMRFTLIHLSPRHARILWTHHHLLLDGWCLPVLFAQILASYKANVKGSRHHVERPRPYREYIQWLGKQDLNAAERYWRGLLAGVTSPTALPDVGVRLSELDMHGVARHGTHLLRIADDLAARATAFAQQRQITLNTVMQGIWSLLLSRYSGQDDVLFGATVSGRPPALPGIETMLGLFINTLPVRVHVPGNQTVAGWLRALQSDQAARSEYEYSPLTLVHGWSDVPRDLTLFESLFVFENYPADPGLAEMIDVADGLRIDKVEVRERLNYPITICVSSGDQTALKFYYQRARYNAQAIDRLGAQWLTLLSQIVENPDAEVADLSLLSSAERRQILLAFNDNAADYPQESCIHYLIEEQVSRTPMAVAVAFQDQELTYAELNAKANRVAHYLRSRGVGPDDRVGLCVARSLDMVVGLLGILKAGAAYVPLDPEYPAERLAFMLEDSQAAILLTQSRLVDMLPETTARVILLDGDLDEMTAQSDGNPPDSSSGSGAGSDSGSGSGATPIALDGRAAADQPVFTRSGDDREGRPIAKPISSSMAASGSHPPNGHGMAVQSYSHGTQTTGISDTDWKSATIPADNLAYVIYTSGSTGTPKGVAIAHGSAVALVSWARTRFSSSELACVLAATSICFDLSVFEIMVPLSCGGKVLVAANALELATLPTSHGITLINTVPSAIAELVRLDAIPESVRVVNLAGEPLTARLADQIYERPGINKVYDLYGPSEDTTYSTCALREPGGLATIGSPIANTQAYILDDRMEPTPIGVPGELYLGGAGLARGYLGRPDLTSEKFIPDPFATVPGGRLYRTGDLARYVDSGDIEFLGRIDHQVKIRGFRIELGEIEARLAQHPSVAGVIVLAREDEPGDKQLVAYLTARDSGQPIAVSDLRPFLKTRLPDHMIPAAFVVLEALPMTPNGKIDRKALPAPNRDIHASPEGEAPRTVAEELVAQIWADILRVPRIGREDGFFDLGGHSLLATQVISRIRNAFQVDLPLRDLFEAPVLSAFSERIETLQRGAQGLVAPPITRSDREAAPPLSFAQQRMWFIDQLEPGTAAYNIPAAIKLTGPLNTDALERTMNEIIRRHESLRTTFGVTDSEPVQLIHPAQSFTLSITSLEHVALDAWDEHARKLAQLEADRPFDLANGPLMRVSLLRLGDEEHIALLTMHHIISDEWSMRLFVKEAAALYEAHAANAPATLPELQIQYADFAVWQRQWLQGDVLARQLAYWRGQLANLPVLDLPTDRPKPAVQSYRGASTSFRFSPDVSHALGALSRREGVTQFMTLLAAWQLLLARYSGQDDVAVGSPIAGRNRAELEGLIGFFLNTLVLRTDLGGDPSFTGLLGRVRAMSLAAYGHQDIPFEQLVDAFAPIRDMSRPPLFQVLFVLHHAQTDTISLRDLTFQTIESERRTAKFDLTLFLTESRDGLSGSIEYATDLFDPATIERMVSHLDHLLSQIAANPEARISGLSLISDSERRQLLADCLGARVAYAPVECVHTLFERQAALTPHAVAAVFAGQSLTYSELNARADQLAYFLQSLGVGPDIRVGLAVERSFDLVIGVLGILKAGGAYVPLDPEYPTERLAFMLEDSQAAILLTQSRLVDMLPETAARVILLDGDLDAMAAQPDGSPSGSASGSGSGVGLGLGAMAVALDSHAAPDHPTFNGSFPSSMVASGPYSPNGHGMAVQGYSHGTQTAGIGPENRKSSAASADNLAYIIYTSGSTGRPKGVAMPHRALVNLIQAHGGELTLMDKARTLQFASPSFDVCFQELLATWATGGTLYLAAKSVLQDSADLVRLMETEATERLFVPTAALQMVASAAAEFSVPLAALRNVVTAGEQLHISDTIRQFFVQRPNCTLHNHYGPTESHVITAHTLVNAPASWPDLPSIGRPIPNAKTYVLDGAMQPVPIGIAGDLYLGGVALARGYLDRPELTAERFVPNPFADETGERLYCTGDRARLHADGNLEFLGRLDDQVKIRGFRVELGEIEAALGQQPGVRQAAAIVREDEPGHKRLVAYVVAESGASLDAAVLRANLRTKLPDYMVPAAYVTLDRMPLSPNGKVDRRSLPMPEHDIRPDMGEAPRTPSEQMVAQIWADVLHVERVGRDENFFELGGHSLLATQVMSRIRKNFAIDLPLRALFEWPTIAGLARQVDGALRAGGGLAAPPIVPAGHDQAIPLSFAQERLWFLDQLMPDNPFYNVPAAVRLTGALDVTALEQTLTEIVRRHEALRTNFAARDGGAIQVIQKPFSVSIPLTDLRDLEDEEWESRARRLAQEEARRPFNLKQGALLRARLLRVGDLEHILLLTMHHIVSDGWSRGILIMEVTSLYEAFTSGRQSPLPELPVQYGDFAVWQRAWLSGDVLDGQMDYWKERLADLTVLELPTDRVRPAIESHAGALENFRLPVELSAALRAVCRRESVTPFMTLLAAFQILLARYCGQDDIAVGAPIANRNHGETENLIGFFVNTLVMRTGLSGGPTVQEVLHRVRETALGAYAHQDLPFEKLVEELRPDRDMSRNPLFQVMLELNNAPIQAIPASGGQAAEPRTPDGGGEPLLPVHAGRAGSQSLGDLTVTSLSADAGISRFDLELHLFEGRDGLIGTLLYSTDLFDAATVRRMMSHFETLLRGVMADTNQPISELPLLTTAERHQLLVAFNATDAAYPTDKCLHELFAEQAARTPNAIAAVCGQNTLTYAQLNARANQLARHLRALGAGQEQLVAICAERGLPLLVGLFGILKSGAAYVPLDANYPAERLSFVLADTRAKILITEEALRPHLPHAGATLCLDSDWDAIAEHGTDDPAIGIDPVSLAYIIYTSGSTGVPKGVAISHANAANLVHWARQTIAPADLQGVMASTSVCFDLSIYEIFTPLISGGYLVLAKNALELPELPEQYPVRLVNTVPSAISELVRMDAIPASVRQVHLAGEPLTRELVERIYQIGTVEQVVNLYAPSETTTYSTYGSVIPGAPSQPTIGAPLANTQFYIVDAIGDPVPLGVTGEIWIGGAGVARGYLNRPGATAEKFAPDPFSDKPGARVYRTGDNGRWLPDGNMEFIGRADHQVKIRGFRIELGEIETALRSNPQVEEAVVIVREDEPGDKRLVGYIRANRQSEEAVHRATDQVADWSIAWEGIYDDRAALQTGNDSTFNIVGWNSSVTGEAIPADEMRAWTDATVASIQALRPDRVYEIGCGTGLLLWRIAPGCSHYLGTDFSQNVIAQLDRRIAATELASRVSLLSRRADEAEGIAPGSFDTVVMNSVVQYFPDGGYLLLAIENALNAVADGGSVFIGDVRSLPLLSAFHTWVQRHGEAPGDDPAAFWRGVRKSVASETELAIDPLFFSALLDRFPRITHVEVRPKQGRHGNEMIRYRYDVVLHVGGEGNAPALSAGPSPNWLNWRDEGLTVESLERRLREVSPEMLCVANVPNARVAPDSRLAELLSGGAADPELLHEALAANSGVEPDDIRQIAEACGYAADISWLSGRPDGAFDIVMRRSDEISSHETELSSVFSSLVASRHRLKLERLTNNPSLAWTVRDLLPELRRHLAGLLPEYMVPTAFVFLDALPLTPNGKVDRKALPAPDHQVRQTAGEAPRTPVEEQIARIWSDVLRIDRIGREENFFELGGHSLLATQVVSRVRTLLGVEVPLREFFDARTLVEFSERVARIQRETGGLPAQRIVPCSREGALPLSFAQERLWIIDQLNPGAAAYNVPAAVKLIGPLNIGALEQAFSEVVRRHEALRTTFPTVAGRPVQVIHSAQPSTVAVTDLEHLPERDERAREMAQLEARRPFDLAAGPLVRASLLRLSDQEHVALLTMHHIISDGWAMGVLVTEMAALYGAFRAGDAAALPALSIQYADFAVWQRGRLTDDVVESEGEYWTQNLAGAPLQTDLPIDGYAGSVIGATQTIMVEYATVTALKTLCRQNDTTLFAGLLAALDALFFRWTGQADLVVGTVSANRNREEIEPLIGCFMNFLPLRVTVDGSETVETLLRRVRASVSDAFAHQDFPFEKVVEAVNPNRSVARNPLYNVGLLLQNYPAPSRFSSDLRAESVPVNTQTALLDLRFVAMETDAGLRLTCEYDTGLFDSETIDLLLASFEQMLAHFADHPEDKISALPMEDGLIAQAESARERTRERTIIVAATFTADPIEQSLSYWLETLGIPAHIEFAPYNQVFQQLLDPASRMSGNDYGANILLIRLEDWTEPARNTEDFIAALKSAAAHSRAPYIVCLCPASPKAIADHGPLLAGLEEQITTELAEVSSVVVATTAELARLYPVADYHDPHTEELGHIPYKPALYTALGTLAARKVYTMNRPPYKVIVLDCDNTLWKGVCGEDGPGGIALDAPYLALQRFMVAQQQAGMLLCLCSKNEEQDVWDVFTRHPDMPLQREHLVAWRINWTSKADNLRALAAELELGLDSFIFVDDNPVECAQVQAECPEVLTLELPQEAADIPEFLDHIWEFDHLKTTDEDSARTALYRENLERKRLLAAEPTLASFIDGLEMQVDIMAMTPEQLPRVAQLMERTNQFNMTGSRRSEPEIREFLGTPGSECLTVSVRDRFGDYGLVGVALFSRGAGKLLVDSFLLSCRALGRGVEHQMFAHLGRIALDHGLESVEIPFVHLEKNAPALNFLASIDFASEEPQGRTRIFRFAAAPASATRYLPASGPASKSDELAYA